MAFRRAVLFQALRLRLGSYEALRLRLRAGLRRETSTQQSAVSIQPKRRRRRGRLRSTHGFGKSAQVRSNSWNLRSYVADSEATFVLLSRAKMW